jgi:large conductance mechanosensitive channel
MEGHLMKGFREFLVTTHAMALAIGVIMGAALGAVVTSLVNDVLMPPIGLALGGTDFNALKIVLRAATGGDPATEVAIRYGAFLNAVIAFVIIAFVVWRLSKLFIREAEAEVAPPSKTCPFCRQPNAVDATKCMFCASPI